MDCGAGDACPRGRPQLRGADGTEGHKRTLNEIGRHTLAYITLKVKPIAVIGAYIVL